MNPELKTFDIPLGSSISPPSSRLVVLATRRPDPAKPPATSVHPVVALQSVTVERYLGLTTTPEVPTPHAIRTGQTAGWAYRGARVVTTPLVLYGGLLVSTDHDVFAGELVRVVACDWPPAEDAVKLAPAIKATEALV
jgi:hypothetical protein